MHLHVTQVVNLRDLSCTIASYQLALRNALDRAAKRQGSRLLNRLPGQDRIERIAQIVGRDVRRVLRVVDTSVIDELAAGIDYIRFRRMVCSEPIGNLVAVVFKDRKREMLLGG